jgi:hypothetical protein
VLCLQSLQLQLAQILSRGSVASAAGAADRTQGPVLRLASTPPLDHSQKAREPEGATDAGAVCFCRPFGPEFLFISDPGAARFALAPGYLLTAPSALALQSVRRANNRPRHRTHEVKLLWWGKCSRLKDALSFTNLFGSAVCLVQL